MKAIWNGAVIAESDDAEIVMLEGNAYFPAAGLDLDFVRPSTHTSLCPWKGTAHYFDIVVEGATNANAVWFYPEPKDAAAAIAGHVAFWNGVQITG